MLIEDIARWDVGKQHVVRCSRSAGQQLPACTGFGGRLQLFEAPRVIGAFKQIIGTDIRTALLVNVVV